MTIAERLRLEGEQRAYDRTMSIAASLRQEGEFTAKLAIAKTMLLDRLDLEMIKKITGLSNQDLKKLLKNHQLI